MTDTTLLTRLPTQHVRRPIEGKGTTPLVVELRAASWIRMRIEFGSSGPHARTHSLPATPRPRSTRIGTAAAGQLGLHAGPHSYSHSVPLSPRVSGCARGCGSVCIHTVVSAELSCTAPCFMFAPFFEYITLPNSPFFPAARAKTRSARRRSAAPTKQGGATPAQGGETKKLPPDALLVRGLVVPRARG